MGFAFLSSWLRETVKDIEDLKGDEQVGCLTYAVKHGQKRAKIMATAINLLGLLAAIYIQWLFYVRTLNMLFWYFMVVDALFVFVLVNLLKAKQKEDFSRLSLWIKILMLSGILSMALFYFEF
jgi:4-hydroxybenzoate polyprenyltransferase